MMTRLEYVCGTELRSQWLALLFHIRKALGLVLGPEVGCPN
jgi:hypothetical protein